MKYISQDDMVITRSTINSHASTQENIDYLEYIPMDQEHYLNNNLNLLTFIKLNNKTTSDDLITSRIKNICWRRCNKNIFNVDELPPHAINWDKNSDITWLFGPKVIVPEIKVEDNTIETSSYYSTFEEDEEVCSLLSDDEDSQSEVSSILSFERKNSVSSSASSYFEVDEDDEYEYNLRSSIKKSNTKSAKRVSFHYIVNTREIINGISFDYDFLDRECL
ncbi:uncharacterized protein RJT21DRAFT_114105 [Scheffersomyces amazonensis]|uniref:uncharacterized protein n=1 Tax=Scheffersomyces amazonensis TaxID=1078765 RepID=UPI00315CC7E7